MEGIKNVFAALGLFLTLCLIPILAGCTCTLAACGSDVAEAEQQSRYVVDEYSENLFSGYKHLFVTTMTDTETGQKWVVVATYEGVAIAPIEEKE